MKNLGISVKIKFQTRYILLVFLLIFVTVISLSSGVLPINSVFSELFSGREDTTANLVLFEIRLPRVLMAILVGSCLGLSGLIAQGVFTNPIAEPSIIGASSGAALGSISALALGLNHPISIFVFGVLGAILLSFSTFKFSQTSGSSTSQLIIIVGIAMSALGIAMVGIISGLTGASGTRSIAFWYFGSLALVRLEHVLLLAGGLTFVLVWSIGLGKQLDLLSFGDNQVKYWGFSANRMRFKAIVLMSILTGGAVSMVGNIAFLGLAAPHIARSIFGFKHEYLITSSMLIGSTLLLVADTLSRTIGNGVELPLGFFTAIIGAPVLIWLGRGLAKRNASA